MLPSNVSTGRVEGRFIVGVQDGAGDEPEFIAAQGSVEFTASGPYLPNLPNPTQIRERTAKYVEGGGDPNDI